MMKALIFQNEVVDLAKTEFEVCDTMAWMDAPEWCKVGCLVVDNVIQPPVSTTLNEEQLFALLRKKRNQLLAETDYLALSDVTLSTEMAEYRQALRDLPANTTDPANPVFPTKPGA
jgi:hypothetical protein